PAAPQGYPAAPAPAWGAPHGGHHGHGDHYGHKRHKSFGHMLFSS
ncbi:zf-TFIIB domain containing protein, partial [Streptomyces sp. SID337]|nr:zf-TFIIB domain containing protein [Streptomyces sp. SID337]